MAAPKTHFQSPWASDPVAVCGTVTTASFLTREPDKVTCAYCRRRNLKVLAKQYPGPKG